MSLEEEHQDLHRRGEMVKFLILAIILFLTVLVVAAARPLIFDQIVPAVMGWERLEDEPANPAMSTATPIPTTPAPTVTTSPTVALPSPTPTLPPTVTPQTYLVQSGDNLTRIANRFGVTVPALIEANNLTNPNRLMPGDRLIIP